jgi:thiol-disulfide isomerase/thioredoxin
MQSQTIDGAPIAPDRRATAMVVFASWCGPCRQELADLGELRLKYPDLRVIGINAYEDYNENSDEERLRKFIAENAPWLTQIVHADSQLLASFGKVPKIPTLFVYDEAGKVVAEFRRNKRPPPSHEELDAAIARALQPSRP